MLLQTEIQRIANREKERVIWSRLIANLHVPFQEISVIPAKEWNVARQNNEVKQLYQFDTRAATMQNLLVVPKDAPNAASEDHFPHFVMAGFAPVKDSAMGYDQPAAKASRISVHRMR